MRTLQPICTIFLLSVLAMALPVAAQSDLDQKIDSNVASCDTVIS